jgi:hypothetical protein
MPERKVVTATGSNLPIQDSNNVEIEVEETPRSFTTEYEEKHNPDNLRRQERKVRLQHIHTFRNKQRKNIKDGYELQREQLLAQNELYKKERTRQWQVRMAKSPFRVDLVADTERIQERHNVRKALEAELAMKERKTLLKDVNKVR